MFGTQSYLDKSMTGIRTFDDGSGAVIQNGNATFNNITVTTLTADNLADCNLVNCTSDDPIDPQDVANKEYCDNNFVDRTNNLTQNINGFKTFTYNTTFDGTARINDIIDFFNGVNNSSINQSGFDLYIKNLVQAGSIYLQTKAVIGGVQDTFKINYLSCDILSPTLNFNSTDTINILAPTNLIGRTINLFTNLSTNIINLGSQTATTNLKSSIIASEQVTFNSFHPICNATGPVNYNNLIRKDYADNTFLDRTNNLTQNVNGLKTFSNNTNFTGSLLSRTNIKLSEYENTAQSNSITLTFPLSETIALRTTSGTANPMTITLPLLTNNERGYVFTFNKLFDTSIASNRNFPVTFNTSGGQGIYSLLDQIGTPTTNTTLLSVEKIQCKLAVGWLGSLLYWIEQTDFSTYDRLKLHEYINPTATNTLVLTLPLPPTITLRTSTISTMTITLPTLTALEKGKIFTFIKINSYNYDVVFNTSSGQGIYPMNNITGTPTTNSTIFPSTKKITRLVVGWFGSLLYWVEASDYSTFDVDTNNGRYVDFATDQTISGTKRFNGIYTQEHSWATATFTNRVQSYMSGDYLVFMPQFSNNQYAFHCKNPNLTTPLLINPTNTTIANNLVSNNITSPSVTGTNNIYTNLSLDGGIINVGSRGSNINIKCNLNIVESAYGNTTKITTINQEGDSCRFTNNGSSNGDFIFEINESGTYNPLIINKTSVNIDADALVFGNLILYDTTPSTKNVIIGLVGNDLFFTPDFNVPSSSYNFKVNDSASTITTPLIINSTNTTISNNLVSNSQATFNTSCPISNTNATLTNHLTTLGFNNGKYIDFLTDQQVSGTKRFASVYATGVNISETLGGGGNSFYINVSSNSIQFVPVTNNNIYKFFVKDATGGQIVSLQTDYSNTIISNEAYFNTWVNLKFRTRIFDTNLPQTNYTQLYMVTNEFVIGPNGNGDFISFYCKDATLGQLQTFKSSALGNTSLVNLTCSSSLISNNLTAPTTTSTNNIYTNLVSGGVININGPLGTNNIYGSTTFNSLSTFSNGAVFNTVLPTTTITASSANELVNYATLTSQGFLSSSSFLSANNNFTGNNTYQNYTTFKASLDLQDGTGAKDGSIKMTSAGVLSINTNVPSGSINFSSDNASGLNFSRATIKENEFNFEVPLTTSISASQYTSFTSTTIGYKTPTGTVLIPSLSSGSGINSGQLILAEGVWKIDYTATINITTTMTTLTSLEVFVANSSNVDLDIQGLDVKNFYGVGVTATQKIKISASGTVVNSGTSTTYNLRLISVFTGGAGNFSGNIVATRLS